MNPMLGDPRWRAFWEQECPRRGTSLRHRRNGDCPDKQLASHPGDACCYCGARASEFTIGSQPVRQSELPDRGMPDHPYAWTIAGICAVANCNRVEDDHPLLNPQPEPNGCLIDHRSLIGTILIGDEGLERRRCGSCNQPVEHREITGDGPQGPAWGKGRGAITDRLAKTLNFIAWYTSRQSP